METSYNKIQVEKQIPDAPVILFDERHIMLARAHDMSPEALRKWQETIERMIDGTEHY